MDAEQVDKQVAAILAAEASRELHQQAKQPALRDVKEELWELYQEFYARLSEVRERRAK